VGNKIVTKSYITEKAKKKIQNTIKEEILNIKNNPQPKQVMKYNSVILGIQNYYRSATNVNDDLREIEFKLSKFLHNQLKNLSTTKGKLTRLYIAKYGHPKRKVLYVQGLPLYPLSGQTFVKPIGFTQATCDYTNAGRQLLEQTKRGGSEIIQYLMTHIPEDMSIELMDNRVSKFIAQHGKCQITNTTLSVKEMEIHHIIPKEYQGTDEYQNIIWVTKDAHKLIHATEVDTIRKYLRKINCTEEILVNINTYRNKAGNESISLDCMNE
jgi:phage pi2 protein 07